MNSDIALDAWALAHIPQAHGPEFDDQCRALVRDLGRAGWLGHAVAGKRHGGAPTSSAPGPPA